MEKFAFVSLDTDLYKPTLAGLEFFWPRMSKGGFIFIHDFGLRCGTCSDGVLYKGEDWICASSRLLPFGGACKTFVKL